jgi:hypothetical protein
MSQCKASLSKTPAIATASLETLPCPVPSAWSRRPQLGTFPVHGTRIPCRRLCLPPKTRLRMLSLTPVNRLFIDPSPHNKQTCTARVLTVATLVPYPHVPTDGAASATQPPSGVKIDPRPPPRGEVDSSPITQLGEAMRRCSVLSTDDVLL